ncbi:MAG: hypothetical protein K2X82_07065 [Gemmataceae bacterium]|nr:hypothetical protein [Gemmataceae bacterium]
MATWNDRYGWRWEDGERERRKAAVRAVRRQADRLAEQVRRIEAKLPAFAAPAARALAAVTADLGGLVALDLSNRGPKYHALSPDDADRLLAASPGVFRLWAVFASDPGFVVAARAANKDTRRANAAARRRHQEATAVMDAAWKRLRPVYDLLDRGDPEAALRYAVENGLL